MLATKMGSGRTGLSVIEMNYAGGQNLSVGAVTAQSAAITAEAVRIVATEDCYFSVGANPTAVITGASAFLPAGVVELVAIKSGWKLAAIQDTVAGVLNIIPAVSR